MIVIVPERVFPITTNFPSGLTAVWTENPPAGPGRSDAGVDTSRKRPSEI
jgi:hypothetical protein